MKDLLDIRNEIDGIDEDMTLDDCAADDAATADIVTKEV